MGLVKLHIRLVGHDEGGGEVGLHFEISEALHESLPQLIAGNRHYFLQRLPHHVGHGVLKGMANSPNLCNSGSFSTVSRIPGASVPF